jgi:membrane-bound lytic murein transglycosylase D
LKKHTLVIALGFLLLTTIGCSAPAVKSITSSVPEITQIETTLTLAPVDSSNIQKYEHEEAVLAHILAYYDKVIAAHREGDFGLAETLVDSAFVLCGKINLDEIKNQSLVSRFNTSVSALAHEYGLMLKESGDIAREDPENWIPDVSHLEQFKSGQWSFDELKAIVNKISRKSDVPIDFNEKVRNWIYYFQTRGHDVMAKWQSRSNRYIPMMQKIFAENNLPVDLAYLSMIESGLSPRAVSRARAVGLWQFIYTTGKLYGLERNEWIDERKDALKSTKAAAKHLQDLFKLYDDWNLVMAAYNCGAGRVSRSTQQSGLNDYWRIDLPKETDNYVPMYMAALIISKAPEIFGFQNIEKESPYQFDTVEVRPYTKISVAAKCAGVDAAVLKDLNCELTRENVPSGKDAYQLKIPKGCREKFIVEYAKMPEEKIKAVTMAKGYTIRKGDTISKVARNYGVSISSLLAANNLKQGALLKIGQKLNIPGSVETVEIAENTEKAPASKAEPVQKKASMGVLADTEPDHITYIVQENDSLYVIAQKYAVSYKDIMVWNKISNPRLIKPGDKLLIKTKS